MCSHRGHTNISFSEWLLGLSASVFNEKTGRYFLTHSLVMTMMGDDNDGAAGTLVFDQFGDI